MRFCFFSITDILKLPVKKVNPFFKFYYYFFLADLRLKPVGGCLSFHSTPWKAIWDILQDLVLPCAV